MKKNRAALFVFLLISPLHIYSDDFQTFSIEYNLNHELIDQIEEAVEKDGLVEAILQTRIFKESNSSFPFPDRQICRADYSKTISKDIFSKLYLIEEAQGNKYYFHIFQNAVASFLHFETEIAPQCELDRVANRYYLKKRAILKLKVYNEPFGIFQFIDKNNRIVTKWEKDFLP